MKKMIIITAFMTMSIFANAQGDSESSLDMFQHISAGVEIGAASMAKQPLASGYLSYSNPNNTFLKFRISSIMQNTYEVDTNEEGAVPGVSEFAILFGKHVKMGKSQFLQFAGGSALVADLRKFDESNSTASRETIIQKNIFGVVGEIKYGLRFTNDIGVTLSVGGNLNQQKSFGTAAFGLIFKGRLFE